MVWWMMILCMVWNRNISTRAEEKESCYHESLPEDYEGTLTMWGWDEKYFTTITQAFQEKYKNVTFEYTEVDGAKLLQKYEVALLTGKELPDIGWAMIDYRGEMFELDMWEHLEEAPYGMSLNQVYEYLHPRMVNSKGNICGIEQSLSPVALMYRKDLAKKYLGTDDPEELETMLSDWDSFIEKGKEVQQKSKGNVYIFFGSNDILKIVQSQKKEVWVDEKTINAEKTFGKTLDLMCRFRDENTADGSAAYWRKSEGERKHIFTPSTFWSVKLMEPLDESEKGQWGLIPIPEGSVSWGGTAMGITKGCKDKRLAWEFLKFATLSSEGAKALNKIGLMTAAKQPYEENPMLASYKSDLFEEEDMGIYLMEEIVPDIKGQSLKKADMVIQERLDLILSVIANDFTVTAEDAMKMLKKELQEAGISTE